jgi:hypothetical protein
MIDVESKVYTPIAVALRDAFSGIFVSGEYVKAPSSFPHVSLVEMDNYTSADRLDTADEERFSTLMYEVNVYSNKTSGKKSECKKIIGFIDDLMYKMNFKRLSLAPVPNMDDATIYRMTARYRVETDGENFYRR